MASSLFQVVSLLVISSLVKVPGAVGTLTSVPGATERMVAVCPGGNLSLICTHDDGGVTRWVVAETSGCIIPHDGTSSIPTNCGPFDILVVSGPSNPFFNSTIQTIATKSLDGTVVECLAGALASSPQVGNITIGVPDVNVTGMIEQNGLSGVTVSIRLLDDSGSECVQEYFAVVDGNSMSSTSTQVGPFLMDLCSTTVISNGIAGTRGNRVDGPNSTLSVFRANTRDLYSNLAVSHSYNEFGITVNFNWMVLDQRVMNQSMVSYSSESSSMISDSPTSHTFQFPYNQAKFTPGEVTLGVSYQNNQCRDTETTVYEVTNFGMATVFPSEPERVRLSFNDSLLASGVMVNRIIGNCEDGSQFNFWLYPPPMYINNTATCANGSYIFQALTSGGTLIGFPFTIEVDSPTTSADPGNTTTIIGGAIGGVCGILLICVIVVVVALICCYPKKGKDLEKDELTKDSSPTQPSDSTYAAPSRKIEHQNAPNTSDEYALVDVERKGKKNKQTPQEALYQDPTAIEHETAPSGDTYAVVDKPKRGSSKKREPDVVPPGTEGLTYADIDVAGSRRKPKPAPQQHTQDPGSVQYADIQGQ